MDVAVALAPAALAAAWRDDPPGPSHIVVPAWEEVGFLAGRLIMRPTSRVAAITSAILLGAIPPLVVIDPGQAQEPALPVRSARGGTLARTVHEQFEVFFYATGLRIFVTGADRAPMDASALKGTATFYHPNSPEPWFTRPLHPSPAHPGQPAESLDLAMDLATVPASGATVTMEVRGLPDPKEPTAKFTMPFAPVASGAGPPQAGQAMTDMTTEAIHYFPVAGFYRTTSGALIWVPAQGYYYGTSVQYYPHAQASGWRYALPAPGPGPAATSPPWTGAAEPIHWELYWRPRALGDTESYQAWLHGEMWRQRLAGRSPATVDGECARCHRR